MKLKRLRHVWAATATGALLALTAVAGPGAAAQPSTAQPSAAQSSTAHPSAARAAAARTAAEDQAPQVLEIRSSAEGMAAPATARPGQVTFRVSTTDPASGWVSLVRPKPGVTFEDFRSSLLKMINAVGPDIVEGSAEMLQKAELLGGTVIHPNLPASFTRTVEPGTYWFFDYRHIRSETPRHSVLTVGGTVSTAERPVPTAALTGRLVDGQPRWDLEGTVRAGRAIRFHNAMPAGQSIEAIFFRLSEGTTEEDVRAYVDDFGDTGAFPDYAGPLDLDQGTGGLPMEPGETSLLELTLDPGRYVVVDFFSDAKDGSSLIKRGHWKIFEVK